MNPGMFRRFRALGPVAVLAALAVLTIAPACTDVYVVDPAPAPAPTPPLALVRAPAPAQDDRPTDLEVTPVEEPTASSPSRLAPASDFWCALIERIEIWKGRRTMIARCTNGSGLALSVGLGRENDGPKRVGSDNRTPEGYYHVAAQATPSNKFHLFIPIDYPSRADAERALGHGTISERDYEAILDAVEAGRLPPQTTPLGGHLGFHGEGDRWRGDSPNLDWTYGCIAVADEQIEFLAEHAPPGTPVIIHP